MLYRSWRTLIGIVTLVVSAQMLLSGQSDSGRPAARPLTAPRAVTPQATATALPSDAFFDGNALQEIRLVINSKDWQSLQEHYLDNTYYPCDFTWQNQTVRNIGIRSRGTGSRNSTKPGLRVDFDRYTTGQTFLGLKSFVLRNQTQDASNMHERLSMLLFKRLGLAASREAHTKLYINNAYAGLFTLVESIDKTFLQNTYGEDGGYLYKYDYPADAQPYFFEDRGTDPAKYVPLPFKPETNETDSHPEVVQRLVSTINTASDGAFRSAIAEFLDVEQFLRHVATVVYLADDDGFLGNYGMNNYYLYRFKNNNVFTFIAWDKSNAFSTSTYSIWHNITDIGADRQNRLMTRVLSFPDLKQRYLDFLSDAAQSANQDDNGTPWLQGEIKREYDQIRDAAYADPTKPFTNDDFDHAVSSLDAFARSRASFVNGEISSARPK